MRVHTHLSPAAGAPKLRVHMCCMRTAHCAPPTPNPPWAEVQGSKREQVLGAVADSVFQVPRSQVCEPCVSRA
jgi:hypothetical protein